MPLLLLLISSLLFSFSNSLLAQPVPLAIPSSDGITISADAYLLANELSHPVVLLCHQAGYSRGEYTEIAPKLNAMGYNCIAIDLRSGKSCNGIENQTAIQARNKKLGTDYLNTIPDIISAASFLNEKYHQKIILWGSSYSAGLALWYAGQRPAIVQAVVAFSPGEYSGDQMVLKDAIQSLSVPAFVTSARSEAPELTTLIAGIKSIQQYVPTGEGKHGSSALYEKQKDHEEYWTALKSFLKLNSK